MKTPDNTPLRSSSTALPASAKPLALLGGLLALSALGPAPAWAAAEPVTACTAEPTNMTIDPGALVDCWIDQAGDSDLFQFSGSAGGQYLISLLNLEDTDRWNDCYYYGYCPKATLYNPDMSVLATLNAGDRSDSKLVTLPSTGTYRIVVQDDNNSQKPPYRVGLERLFPASPTAVSTDFGLANPAEINPRLDQDLYTFDGVSGALVNISQGGNGMKGLLYGPDKTLVDTWTGSQSKFLTLPQTGAYTFHAFDDGNTDTQSYNFEPVCLTPPAGYVDCKGTPDDEPHPITCNGLVPTIEGTAKSERITGTPGNDVIAGLGGNDRILGLGGNDVICGNSDQAKTGSDTLLGGEGNDTLIGNGVLLGEAGNDSLKGGNARDSLLGGPGDDTLDAQGGDDLAIGGAGNDKLLGGAGANDLCDKDANDLTPATGCELRFTP